MSEVVVPPDTDLPPQSFHGMLLQGMRVNDRFLMHGLKRLFAAGIAFGVGWIVYMIAMAMTVYDGFPSLVIQPFLAAITSGLFVSVALFVGLLFRLPGIGTLWRKTLWPALILFMGSCLVLCFGYSVGIRESFTNPESGKTFEALHSAAALTAYFFLIFSIANWPIRKPATEVPVPG